MPKLDKLQAETIHTRYAATLTTPLSIDNFIPGGELDEVTKHTYEHGMMRVDEQILRIRLAQFNSMDPNDPYDIGVANAIQLLSYILTGVLPTFIPKPASALISIDQLQSENDKLAAKVKKLNTAIGKLQESLVESESTKALAILALEAKHARELAEAKKAAEPAPEPKPEPEAEPPKPKKKSWLGKSK